MDDQSVTPPAPPDWIALARDAYSASSTWFDASVRQQIEADLRQFQGLHPTGSKYLAEANKGRSKLFRPKTRTTIRKNEAAAAQAFFATNDVVKVSPENEDDPVQAASAAVMGELLQYRLTKSIPWFMTLVGAYQDAQTVGLVASYQYWEYNEKKQLDRPAIRLIPIENLRFDPGASWTDPVGTSPYIIELIPMYVGAVKSRMKTLDPKTGEPRWKTLPDAVIMGATKTYGDTIRLQREAPRTDSKYQTQANNNFNVVWVHRNIIEVDDTDYVYYTLGCEHLLTDPVPLSEAYFHGRRPYVVGSAILETHKLYTSSVPRITHDVQAEINEVANQRIDNVKLAMNKRYFARRNKQVDLRSVTRNVPGSVTLMQDVDDVKVVEFNDVTGSSYKEQEILNLDFDDVAGTFSGASVQSNRKLNETVGGMQMLDAGANQVAGYQLRTFVETWVEPVLRQLVLLEQYYETDEAVIALCGQAAQLQKFGLDAVTDAMLMNEFTLNVNVGMGATNPADQVAQFVQGMTALGNMLENGALMQAGLNVQEVIKELFGKLGYKDGGRFFKFDDQDPMVTQLQAKVQELQQALDAKMDPQLLAATIRKIDAEVASMHARDKVAAADAVKKGSEAQFSAMQTAEVIAAVPAVAPIADELMRAAGYTEPNPAGIDPGFPQPGGPAAGLAVQNVTNKRTGVGFMPGAPSTSSTLNPLPPLPATPGTGQRRGIETLRPDSIAQAAFADGGLVDVPYAGLDQDPSAQMAQQALLVQQAQQAQQPQQAQQALLARQRLAHQRPTDMTINGFTDATNAALRGAPHPTDLAINGFTNATNAALHGDTPMGPRHNILANFADGGLIGNTLTGYDNWSQQHPYQKLALDLLPGTNVVASGLDVASDLHKGEYWTAAGDALGLIPGVKVAKTLMHSRIARAAQALMDNRHAVDATVNAVPEFAQKVMSQAKAATPPAPADTPAYPTQQFIPNFANGGLIHGPGSGTSDSIPALAAGRPAAVSNGEYLVPARVVAALGHDFFESLIEQLHSEAPGTGGAPPADMAPLAMDNGDFIIPADVVAALGRDFFDKLVQTYGGGNA